ncbi:MAG: hypothetical protein ACRBK7_10595 [Acidimicrobiales bacterium]
MLRVAYFGVLLATLAAVSTSINVSSAILIDTETIGSNTLTTDTLAAPTTVSASDGLTSTISWTPTDDTYAEGHRVYRATSSGGPYTQVAQLTPRTATSYVDSPADGTYYYVVRGYSASWESADSNESQAYVGGVTLLGSWQTGLSHSATAGSSRTLVVVASNEESSSSYTPTLSGLTYGGQPLTKVVSQTVLGSGRMADLEVWILDEAGIAAAANTTLTPTWASTPGSPLYAHAMFGGTSQVSPTASPVIGTSSGHTPNPVPLSAVSPSDGDMVIVAATAGYVGSYVAQGSFTLGSTEETATLTTALGAAYLSSDGSSVTPSILFNNSVIYRQVAAAFILQAP